MLPAMSVDPRTPLDSDNIHELVAELGTRAMPDTRLGRAQERALAWAERVTTWGPTRPVAELGWRVYRRDQSVAGSVMAAAIAYRLFIWMLPLSLTLVSGLGLYARAASEPSAAIIDSSLGRYVANSVAAAADKPSTFAQILIFISSLLVFLYESYVLLRTLRAVSSFAWGIPVRPMRHAPVSTLVFVALLLGWFASPLLIDPLSGALPQPFGLLLAIAALAILPLVYILMNLLLMPHGARRWTDLVPGAILFYVAVTLIQLFNSLILFPWLARKEETYGVLGVAAGLLFALFVIGRSFELAASLNAVLLRDRRAEARDRTRDRQPEAPPA